MFLIGILSTPLPYFLMAFAYLIGMSMGLFQKNDKLATEEYSSNIINYEVLTPISESEATTASYAEFLQKTMHAEEALANFDEFLMLPNLFNSYSPPREESLQYNCLITSNLFNRPPPVTC